MTARRSLINPSNYWISFVSHYNSNESFEDSQEGRSSSLNNSLETQISNYNTSNTSHSTIYSADEVVINQRGRKSLINTPCQTKEIFLETKRLSMLSPDRKSPTYLKNQLIANKNNTSPKTSNSNLSDIVSRESEQCNKLACSLQKVKRNLNKSLLRTPVKRRLRKDSGGIRKRNRQL